VSRHCHLSPSIVGSFSLIRPKLTTAIDYIIQYRSARCDSITQLRYYDGSLRKRVRLSLHAEREEYVLLLASFGQSLECSDCIRADRLL
jgi:hypothetical protein